MPPRGMLSYCYIVNENYFKEWEFGHTSLRTSPEVLATNSEVGIAEVRDAPKKSGKITDGFVKNILLNVRKDETQDLYYP